MTTATETVQLRRIVNLKPFLDAVTYCKKDSANYDGHVSNLEAAKIHAAKYEEVKAAASAIGYSLNAYPIRTMTGQMAKGTAWVKKVDGKTTFLPYENLLPRLGVDLSNLPAIND